eukprot:scaffold1190_cov393-Prasinococcus_capsulatus_cf.AAC.2
MRFQLPASPDSHNCATQGLVYSHKKVYEAAGLHPPPITRLMACNKESYPYTYLADTHVHPNWATHPRTKDRYTPYNKPFSIKHWLEHDPPEAEWIVVLDADMIIRKPIDIETVGVEKGRPVSARYGYLIGKDHSTENW